MNQSVAVGLLLDGIAKAIYHLGKACHAGGLDG